MAWLVFLLLWPSRMYSRKFGVRLHGKWRVTEFGETKSRHLQKADGALRECRGGWHSRLIIGSGACDKRRYSVATL